MLLGLLQDISRLSINTTGTTFNFDDQEHSSSSLYTSIHLITIYSYSTDIQFPDRQCVCNLSAELVDLSVLMAGNDKLSQRSPHSAGNFVVAARYRQVGLVVLCSKRGRDSLVIPLRGDLLKNIFSLSEGKHMNVSWATMMGHLLS